MLFEEGKIYHKNGWTRQIVRILSKANQIELKTIDIPSIKVRGRIPVSDKLISIESFKKWLKEANDTKKTQSVI